MPNEPTDSLHPVSGVRISLERRDVRQDGADYAATVYTPTEKFELAIAIENGQVKLDGQLETKLTDLVNALARTMTRSALATTPPAWPERIVRWRAL